MKSFCPTFTFMTLLVVASGCSDFRTDGPATGPADRRPDPRPITSETISPQSGRSVGFLLFAGHGDPAARRELASLGPGVFGFFLEVLHEECQIWNNQICVLDALLYFKEDRSVFLPDIF